MGKVKQAASTLVIALASACASPVPLPTGPGILVLPGTGKSFEEFRADDQECRVFALSEVQKAGPQTDDSYFAATRVQRQYDHAFTQCMFARGHKVPVSGAYSDRSQPGQSAASTPPPPPGKPPAEAPSDYRPQ